MAASQTVLAPLQGAALFPTLPGVSLRSTPGYLLASLRDALPEFGSAKPTDVEHELWALSLEFLPAPTIAGAVARRIRIQYPGALYHVVSRGDRGGPIFVDDTDRECFLRTLEESRAKTSWRIHAYVLMPDHFHLVIHTPEANLVMGTKWLLGTFTSRFNVRHGVRGHLFAGRYKAVPIDPRGEYLRTAVDYVHLNPARAKLIQDDQLLSEFPWSSLGSYLDRNDANRNLPAVEPVLAESGTGKAGRKSKQGLEQHLESRRAMELNKEFHGLRHGWFFGSESFRAELLARLDSVPGANHVGPEISESEEAKAERIVARELARLEWSEQDLRERAKGDLEKIRIVEMLRRESTMTLGWIAERLCMGTTGYLSHLLYWRRRGVKPGNLRKPEHVQPPTASARRKSNLSSTSTLPERRRITVHSDAVVVPSTDHDPFTFDPSFD